MKCWKSVRLKSRTLIDADELFSFIDLAKNKYSLGECIVDVVYENVPFDEEYGKKDPLFLNSFGCWEKIAKNSSVLRPTGRKDYQLLYVSSGTIIANNQKLKNGEFYIMVPDELQDYTYVAVENSKYYWIHFTGNKIEEILKYYYPGVEIQ